jgi:FkbM family methyltransferase
VRGRSLEYARRIARQHFEDSLVPEHSWTVIAGAVAAWDGHVRFPALVDPAADYGASVKPTPLSNSPRRRRGERTRAYSIRTLVSNCERVDLLHVDVQGAEVDAIDASLSALNDKVRRVVIGTHSREIEHRLLQTLARAEWVLEHDQPCVYSFESDVLSLRADGCQVWSNPKLSPKYHKDSTNSSEDRNRD